MRPARLAWAAAGLALTVGCGGPATGSQGTGGSGQSGEAVRYTVSFPNAVHHEAEVTAVFSDLGTAALELRMSRTSPGRYALHEFAKNVYNVRIQGADGAPITAERPDLHQWTVSGHGGQVTVQYTLFGDRIDGTYAGIDLEGAMLNAPASMMWARGLEDRSVEVTYRPPEGAGWKVATQLVPTDNAFTYTAPDYAYFLDSPTLLADFDLSEWTVESGGTPYQIRFALHHSGDEAEFDRYIDMVKKVVDQEMAVFGELPAFDYGTYTFIAVYQPWAAGDGMEHRNSTVLTRTGDLRDVSMSALGTVAHEFFHAWNMERIRSSALEPFDFEQADVSEELWFGEGFTSYYDDLAMVRAGVIDLEEFARRMGGLVNAVTNSPGRRFHSPIEMSMQAPFVDAAVSVDAQNRANTFISYYTWGAAIGLGLDLTIRAQYPERTLDDFMRDVWARHGKPFLPYDVDDLESQLGQTLGDEAFAADYFDRFIRGATRAESVEIPDFPSLLNQAGFVLRRRSEELGLGGTRLRFENRRAIISSPVLIGSPLYEAGAETGDAIVSLNGATLSDRAAIGAALRGVTAGDRVPLVLDVRGGTRNTELVLAPDPTLELVPIESTGQPVSEDVRQFRTTWLGPR
ncbi:MAG: M61 family metallopeptidase [Longimicrobiales bacterium]